MHSPFGIIGVMWSRYSAPALMHSWRSRLKYLDPPGQMNYILSHPSFMGNFFAQIFTHNISKILYGTFNFFGAAQKIHYADSYHLIVVTLLLFLAVMLLAYPKREKFDLRTRIGTLFIVLVIYVGTCLIQLLTWASVGKLNLGLSTRYFVPLFALFPIISKSSKSNRRFIFLTHIKPLPIIYLIQLYLQHPSFLLWHSEA